MKDQIESNKELNTSNSKQYIKSSSAKKSPKINEAKKFSMMLLKNEPQAHMAFKKLEQEFNGQSKILPYKFKENDRSSTPDFKDVRPQFRYSMSKSSERFAFKNLAEKVDLHGSFKHYVNKDGNREDKSCWDNLINKTEKEVKFNALKKPNETPDHITDLIKTNNYRFKKTIICPKTGRKLLKNDVSHSGIKDFLDHIPKVEVKRGKKYIQQESDVLNVKQNYVDFKRSKSAINVRDLKNRGYAGVSSYKNSELNNQPNQRVDIVANTNQYKKPSIGNTEKLVRNKPKTYVIEDEVDHKQFNSNKPSKKYEYNKGNTLIIG